MKAQLSLRRSVTSAIGMLICSWSAALLSYFFQNRHGMLFVPFVLLVVIALVAIRCGVVAGIVGCLLATLIFAVFLYRPLGSPIVANKDARTNLSWLLLGGLAFSYLLGQRSGRERSN